MMTRKKFVGIQVGDTFSCYEELRSTMESVQQDTQVLLYMRDSITLKGAVKKRPNVAKMANKVLLYHSIHYCCVFGGRYRNKKAQEEMKKNGIDCFSAGSESRCEAEIKIGLSEDFQLLEVRRIKDFHNHTISKSVFDLLGIHRTPSISPRYRIDGTSPETKKRPRRSRARPRSYSDKSESNQGSAEKVKKQTTGATSKVSKRKRPAGGKSLKSTKKKRKIDKHLTAEEQSPNLLEKKHTIQIQNDPKKRPKLVLASKLAARKANIHRIVEQMKKVEGALVDVHQEGKRQQAIYFQTLEMKRSFMAYPELLLIDASCRIPQLAMTLYILMNADGNGECVIICLWLVSKQDQDCLNFLMKRFKEYNREWNCIKVLMTDRDCCLFERDSFLSHLPQALSFVCFFHVMRNFRKEVSSENVGLFLPHKKEDKLLNLLEKMALAKTETMYLQLVEKFKLTAPSSITEYFLQHWNSIPAQWVDGLKNPYAYFLSQTNNRLDAIIHMLKSIADNFSSPVEFVQDIMESVHALQKERKQRALDISTAPISTGGRLAEIQYQALLTPYALSFVKRQLAFAPKVVVRRNISDCVSSVKSKYGDIMTGTTFCPCVFFTATGLPCSHIFAVRRQKRMPSYHPSLCIERWTQQYLKNSHSLQGPGSDLGGDEFDESTASSASSLPPEIDATLEALMEVAPFIPTCIIPSKDDEQVLISEKSPGDQVICISGQNPAAVSPFDSGKHVATGPVVPPIVPTKRKRGSSPDINWIGLQEVL